MDLSSDFGVLKQVVCDAHRKLGDSNVILAFINANQDANCLVIKWNDVPYHESNDVDNTSTSTPKPNSPQNRGSISQPKDCKALQNWFGTTIQSPENYRSLTNYEILGLIKTANDQQELQCYSQWYNSQKASIFTVGHQWLYACPFLIS